MNTQDDSLKTLLTLSLLRTVENRYDPYSIMFSFDDVTRSILESLILENDSYGSISLIFNSILSELRKAHFDAKDLETFHSLVQMSKYYIKKYEKGRKEIISSINNFLHDNITDMSNFYIDFDYQSIQVVNINLYNQIRDVIQQDPRFKKSPLTTTNLKDANNSINSETEVKSILKKMYQNAPQGYQMSMLHLFGIMYGSKINRKTINKLVMEVTGKASLAVEIGKGAKLSGFVEIKSGVIDHLISQ